MTSERARDSMLLLLLVFIAATTTTATTTTTTQNHMFRPKHPAKLVAYMYLRILYSFSLI